MTVVDSSGWLEYFLNGPSADVYAVRLEDDEVLVPTVVLYEVYKVLARDVSREQAIEAAAQMKAKIIVELSDDIALLGAELALEHKLAMADALVYATAQVREAILVTGDFHFRELADVEYVPSQA